MVGSIDPRCETIRGTHWPVKVAGVFGTRVAENHLGQRSQPHQQAGHMDASDPIRPRKTSCGTGAVHIWVPARRPGRRECGLTRRMISRRVVPAFAGTTNSAPL